jgi:hypothetical protein
MRKKSDLGSFILYFWRRLRLMCAGRVARRPKHLVGTQARTTGATPLHGHQQGRLLAANFGQQASGTTVELPDSDWAALDSFASANGLLADVPEPASVGWMVLAGFGMLGRRRCRERSTLFTQIY